MVKSRLRFWAIATVLIAAITGVLVYRYLLEIQKTAQPEPLAEVVVARVRIPSGARITQDMVKTSQLPAKYVHPMAINDRKDAVNQYAGVDILPDQAVLTGHLVTESNVKELPFKIPEGYRAITVAVNPVSGVGGHVKPGHYVDILVACKETPNSEDVTVVTLLQNVLVLATGPELDKKDEIQAYDEITLAVKPDEAQLVTLSESVGRIKLTLRPAGQSQKMALPQVGTKAISGASR